LNSLAANTQQLAANLIRHLPKDQKQTVLQWDLFNSGRGSGNEKMLPDPRIILMRSDSGLISYKS